MTASPGRNDSCPCGSGKKFKKCCKQRASAAPASPSATAKPRKQSQADASAHLGKLSSGSEEEFLQYIQPLLERAGGDPFGVKNARDCGLLCWNLAMLDLTPAGEEAEIIKVSGMFGKRNPAHQGSFVGIVRQMLPRHREMFPEKHGRRTRVWTDQGKLLDPERRKEEPQIDRPGRNDSCPCGSGKTYWWCCSARDRFAASSPAEDAAQEAVDDRAYALKRDKAEKYFREKIQGCGPITQMMEFVKPFLTEMDDDPMSIRFVMDIGLLCWNIALLFDPGDDEEREIAETAKQITFEKPDHPAKFTAIAKWMIARHRVKFPELHAEPSELRRELRAILHPE